MSFRFMRILVFFDLPVLSSQQRKQYTKFRKHLVKSGFFMMQESVYSKLVLNATAAENVRENIRKNKPTEGLIQILTITEKQFARMEFLIGSTQTEILNDTNRLVIL
ncbi:MAG: CRISPR-associated endonuclease Cas2 [Sphaerochaetaceae bacterium]|nr:CRISPR-associated endonuclease Cas2 [Sphaerochaetaceae bacterium]